MTLEPPPPVTWHPAPAHGLMDEHDFDTPAGPLHAYQCFCGRIFDRAEWDKHQRDVGLTPTGVPWQREDV
ncbi:MAG: hypothetical protein ACO1ON_13015 [Nocardioides sp.]